MLFCVNPAGDLLKLHHIISISISIIAHRRTTARIARAGASASAASIHFIQIFTSRSSVRFYSSYNLIPKSDEK